MPYTPPSQLSPAASQPTSPAPSRSTSYLNHPLSPEITSNGRPNLPRSSASSSYLSMHRRSPSAQSKELTNSIQSYESLNHDAHYHNKTFDPYGSVRQSPPPVNNLVIPSGMTISPPDSSHNSSDDEDVRGRTREIEKMEELKAAISVIQQRKSGSPDRNQGRFAGQGRVVTDQDSPQLDGASSDPSRLPLSRESRKVSHSRSTTESTIPKSTSMINSPVTYQNDSEESDDSDGPTSRPPMVRKKSGELVRPALRPSSRRRPSSMPGTPTYSKAVHFDSHLEHVRHFLQVDRPLAVSAGSSPVEGAYESESEFPFGNEESSQRPRSTSPELDIKLANFPPETADRQTLPVRVERTFLSADGKSLVGTIAVQNIAFQKAVVTRFTLDYWKTVSEVVAEYNNDVRKKYDDGCDRFTFSVRLADQANLENKTLFFCVRYQVNGQEYWDNNSGYNYQVDFVKKAKPRNPPKSTITPPTLGARPLNSLPRTRQSPPTSAGPRPKQVNASFDDFSSGFDNFESFVTSADALMGEPKIKLKSPRSRAELVAEAPAMRRTKSSVQPFGTRYDFASSLNAAKSKAWNALGEESGLSSRPDAKQSSHEVPAFTASKSTSLAPPKLENGVKPAEKTIASVLNPIVSKPAALVSEKPALTSQSYQELVDKYCFFGNDKPTQSLTSHALSMVDGALDDLSSSEHSISGSRSSGTSTPTGGGISPTPPSSRGLLSLQISRSSSPFPRTGSCSGARSRSPVAFGYPYHQSANHDLLATTTATAIRG